MSSGFRRSCSYPCRLSDLVESKQNDFKNKKKGRSPYDALGQKKYSEFASFKVRKSILYSTQKKRLRVRKPLPAFSRSISLASKKHDFSSVSETSSSFPLGEDMIVKVLTFMTVDELRSIPIVCSLFEEKLIQFACCDRARDILSETFWLSKGNFKSWPHWLSEIEFVSRQNKKLSHSPECRISSGSGSRDAHKNLVLNVNGDVHSVFGIDSNSSVRGGKPQERRQFLRQQLLLLQQQRDLDANREGKPELFPSFAVCNVVASLRQSLVVQVSVGAFHVLLLSTTGDVFSFGDGFTGQLGHGDTDDREEPTVIQNIEGRKATQVSAGTVHSVVLFDNGTVFSFGQGKSGRLGTGDENTRLSPTFIPGFQDYNVEQISAGGNHTLAIASQKHSFIRGFEDQGFLFSWGSGFAGKLGHGDTQKVLSPKRIEIPGRVFSWGYGVDGQLGHGSVEHGDGVKEGENKLFPVEIETLQGTSIRKISAGSDHSLVLTEECRTVYSFGMGGDGQLGVGDFSRRMIPTEVLSLNEKNVTEISAGSTSNLILTQKGDVYRWGTEVIGSSLHSPEEILQDNTQLLSSVQVYPTLVSSTHYI
eukprot:GSMAST32.ASY1.ANO1.1720.1 assembled CDS